ncbi:hypothetical protein Btru_073101 [Bulinus truncatus]|nr:hypothetical protein Btru_073101 [Bulinus truncatus]
MYCTSCPDHKWRCASGQCITTQKRCDGVTHCNDESDEENCAPCLPGYLKCNNDKCVANDTRCNSVNDCIDNSDEEYCQLCQPGSWQCDSTRCIKEEYVCNGNTDCLDATDESNCTECGAYRWKCANGTCIALVQLCDGQQDCPDGSDETNCAVDRSKETVAIVLSVVLALLAAGVVLVVAVVRQGKLNIKSENNRQPGMAHTDNIEEYLDIDHYDYVSRSNEVDVTFDEENSLDINSKNGENTDCENKNKICLRAKDDITKQNSNSRNRLLSVEYITPSEFIYLPENQVSTDANRMTTPDGVASVNDLRSASRSIESLTSHAAKQNNDVLHSSYITPLDVYNDINTTVNELKQNVVEDIHPEAQHMCVATKNMDDPDRATSQADESDEQNGARLLHSDYITPVDVIYSDVTPEELKNGKNELLTQVKQLFETPVNIDMLATDVYTYTGDKCDDRFHNPIGGLQTKYLTPVDVIYPPGANQMTAIASSDEFSTQVKTTGGWDTPRAGSQVVVCNVYDRPQNEMYHHHYTKLETSHSEYITPVHVIYDLHTNGHSDK